MPVLKKDFRPKLKIEGLPSYPDAVVTVYTRLLVKDVQEMSLPTDPTEMKLDHIVRALPRFIAGWNFTDEDEKPLAITPENIGFLTTEDVTAIVEQITEKSGSPQEKKS